ncbi:MAG: hypothetical protein Ct9H300mP13_1320 [Gammaproteobacteria bacterium]|nr:MAG: hypothetical protein Ct9H300mP13_1320 [Gammaproteobacteria bacterium]
MFQSLPDEEWFWVLHIVFEARGAPAVVAGIRLVEASKLNDIDQIKRQLEIIHYGFETIIELAGRMEEGCRPEVYYETLRPFLFAHPEGVVFDGVQAFGGKPQTFLGQTGAQSALIPSICASLGLRNERSELTSYLEAVRAYMPEPHRKFVAGLDGQAVRDCVSSTESEGRYGHSTIAVYRKWSSSGAFILSWQQTILLLGWTIHAVQEVPTLCAG